MHTFSYTTSEATQRLLMRSAFWNALGRKWIVIFVCLVAGPALLVAVDAKEWNFPGWALCAVGVALGLQWVKGYFTYMTAARSMFRLLEDPTVTVRVTEEFIETASGASARQVRWSKLNRLVLTKDALLLYDKILLVIAIPRAAVPSDVEAAILSSVR